LAPPPPADLRDLVSLLRTGGAPREIRQFAARGLLPLDADDQMRALLTVVDDPEQGIAEMSRAALAATPPDALLRFLSAGAPTSIELDIIARRTEDSFVLEQIISSKSVADETLEVLARTATGRPQEALIVNQVRLLRRPSLIDALFANPNLTADGRRRLLEVREEFFEKEVRRKEAERRLEQEAAEAAAASVIWTLTAEEQAEVDAARAEDEAEATLSEEQFKTELGEGRISKRIATMTVSEKIKLAYAGGKEERRILIGDSNRLVNQAVLKSRGITLNEIESICQMRHLDDEVFRTIAGRREWARKPSIVLALVKNPKVPLAITMPLVRFVPMREIRLISRDSNLADGLRVMARKTLEEKRR
jgi:hypothetical protein